MAMISYKLISNFVSFSLYHICLKKWKNHELAFLMYVSLLFVPFSFKTFVALNFYLKYWSRYASEWDPREPGHTKVKKNRTKGSLPQFALFCPVRAKSHCPNSPGWPLWHKRYILWAYLLKIGKSCLAFNWL